ncbi:MAG: Crp/Fnr family transcriptional regulator [Betaproteobacteria bacterium]|nr:Crp/Fnr family transcriptional regulator [Betaproteobacteria bacterium]MDE2270081.1 Crp/Fnr family transcriptional regulator [Betaproteobacteria bacterium]OYV29334.1 MAG: hypothetical protein B7Z79_10740 [Thiomonas sp. 20-64-9]CQR42935.1 hypothetical protein THICB3310092 [Thiomonas sp. CB3]
MTEASAHLGIGQYDDPGIAQSADRSFPSGGAARAVRFGARGLILDRVLASAFDAAERFMVFRRGCTLLPQWGQRGAWLVLAGSFKEAASWGPRGEKIVDLVLPGAVLLAGWNATHDPNSSVRAVALEDSVGVPVDAATTLHGISSLTQLLAAKLARSLRLRAMLQWPVDARVAQFLVDFAAHSRATGGRDDELRLPLKGCEIANLLSMRHEVFSRGLRRLEEQAVIERGVQSVRILDHSGLVRAVEGSRASAVKKSSLDPE